ncbi:MFS transporter [Staphylococcus muscae]|uniref:Drug antiporter protein n=1 Tax=Staphylococcus muscae TaxID=1294 RepID=A0A240C9Q0_9STAP|nr:MFS transporter [Staphylococcus muscae]AVQ33802.1 MFS transporter [Staphylococcus muscae]PNZ06309.1 MFS transporter [Staphylococcus muscae]GGA87842.1 putative drug antiporter protein precursor [Staphylococcus muscae]SNW04312.1 macrolide-efflux protein [Staphylococcus muscae]
MYRLSNNFKHLYYSQLFANTGDIIYIVALIAYVYHLTGEARYSALIPICVTTFLFLSGLVANYWYIKFNELQVMRFSQMLKTFMMINVLCVISLNISIIVLFLCICINSFLDGLINPVKNAMIPMIEDKSNIVLANSKINVMNNTIQVVSWALGGILIASIGYQHVVLITIVTYALSVYFIFKIKINTIPDRVSNSLFQSFSEMIRFNRKNIHSIYLNTTTMVESFAHSAWISAILLVFVKEFLQRETYIFGMINSVFFAGIIFAGLIVSKYSRTIEEKTKIILIFGAIICAVLNMLFGMNKWIVIVLLISFAYGFFDQLRAITMHSTIQVNLEEVHIVKVYTLNNMVYSVGFCIGTLCISHIADEINVTTVYFVAGFAYLLSALVSLVYTKRRTAR